MSAAAVRVLPVATAVRRNSNSSASVDAMGARNGRRAAEDRSRNVLLSNSVRRNSRYPLRKPRANGQDAVAAVAAAVAEKTPLRIQPLLLRSSRGHCANRVLPVRRRQRVPIRSPERRVPRAKAPSAAGVFGVGGGAVAGARKAPHNCALRARCRLSVDCASGAFSVIRSLLQRGEAASNR